MPSVASAGAPDMLPVVRSGVPDTVIVARARDALAKGPLTPAELLAHVLFLPGAPERVAQRLAASFFGKDERFAVLADGRWALRAISPRAPDPEASSPSLLDVPFAVVDVETTGSALTQGDRVIEVAVFPVQHGKVGDPMVSLVNPGRGIAPRIASLTGITPGMVARAPRFEAVADAVVGALTGRVFVAHNATFDWNFVTMEVERATGRTLQGDRLCTIKLARVVLPQLRRRSLDALAHYFGIEIAQRHRAGADARATAELLARLLTLAADRGLDSWSRLRQRMERRAGRSRRTRSAMPSPMTFDPTL